MSIDLTACHIFCDVDGTLLMGHEPPQCNVDAIDRLITLGGKFSLATGRNIYSASRIAKLVSTNAPSIVLDGAAIYDYSTSQLIDYLPLPAYTAELMEQIVTLYPAVGAQVSTLDDTFEVGAKRAYAPDYALDFRGKIAQIEGPWLKLVFFTEPEDLDGFLDDLRKLTAGEMAVMASGDRYASVMARGCSKGAALGRLIDQGLVDHGQTVAIGDYDNDIELLQTAARAYCPQNAHDRAKAMADYIVGHAEQGAVADVIDHLLEL